MRAMRRHALCLALALGGPVALGQSDYGQVPERFTFQAGGFFPSFDTTVRVGSDVLGVGTTINLEDDLGFDKSQSSFDVGAALRLGRRHRFTFDYFQFTRDATKGITKEIHFENQIYRVGTNVDASTTIRYFGFSYQFSVFKGRRGEGGLQIGVDYVDLKAALSASASVSGGGASVSSTQSVSDGVSAPVPLVGVFGSFEIVPGLSARATVQYLELTIQAVNGRI
jgi:hypothetical protein